MIDLETGISVEEKEEVVKHIHETLSNIDDVETSYIIDDGSIFYTLINMTKGEAITKEQKEVNNEILRELRSLEEDYPINSVQSAMSMSSGQPVQIQVKGENYEELKLIADDLT